MGQTPDELKREVERTRADLSSNVDTLADRVNPARVARRRTESIRQSAVGIKERVMGSATEALQTTQHSVSTRSAAVASSVGESTASLGSSVSDAAQRAPDQIRAGTQGSPLAAGLIAFGAGMLAAALFPASQTETQAANALRENADLLEPAKEALTESVQQVKENLAPAAKESAQHVKDSAAAAVSTTTDQAKQSGSELAGQVKDTTGDLRDHSTDSVNAVRDQLR
jgi:hypothetical protein